MSIFEKVNYLNPLRYITGRIVEYDIKAANINCLLSDGRLSIDEYNYLNSLPKQQREIEIGVREKADPTLYTSIAKKIKEAKVWLAQVNNIPESQVVRVANDAVYINSMFDLKELQYDNNIRFVPKSVSNIFVNINKILFFISFDNEGNIHLEIKNVDEKVLPYTYNYIISEILSMILILYRSSPADALNYISNFTSQYLTLNLPVEYYRELPTGRFRIKNYTIKGDALFVDRIFNDSDKYSIDTDTNYNLIRELWSIAIEKYNLNNK